MSKQITNSELQVNALTTSTVNKINHNQVKPKQCEPQLQL